MRIIILVITSISLLLAAPAGAKVTGSSATGFAIEHELVLAGTPEAIYDAFTNEIANWWDHAFSEKPKRLVLEAKPGGAFLEIFDDAGNGALHGTVIYAHRGRRLRITGPFGFSGQAIELVNTLDFEAIDAGKVRVKLTVRAWGEISNEWPALVDDVWRHFLVERFKPYVEKKAGAGKAAPAANPNPSPGNKKK